MFISSHRISADLGSNSIFVESVLNSVEMVLFMVVIRWFDLHDIRQKQKCRLGGGRKESPKLDFFFFGQN